MSKHQRMTPKIVKMTEIEAKALEWRKAGLTFEQIAVQLKLPNKGSAWKAVDAGLRKLIQEPAEEMRKIEVARLDSIVTSLWPGCLKGDLLSIDRFLKVQERRARLLGLDIPVKQAHEVTGPNGAPLNLGTNVVIYLPNNGRDDHGPGDNGNGNGNGRIPAEAVAKGEDDGSRLPS